MNQSQLRSLGWTWTNGEDPVVSCSRSSFSADYTKYLFAAIPPRGDSADHLGVIDLRTGAVTDLTAPRQQHDFSSPILNETVPTFLGAGGDRISFGSETIAFVYDYQDGEAKFAVTSLANPSQATPVATTRRGYLHEPMIDGHFEQLVAQTRDREYDYASVASGDGRLVTAYDGAASRVL
ncbi:MAG: hypothetical protein LC808_30940, partial [Actinobacteria bacterium]|nr:hypothetical protein [Actinomycetota bacterium]